MQLEDVAIVRTGLVVSRFAIKGDKKGKTATLNLKCVDSDGFIDSNAIEILKYKETIKDDFLTKKGDVLVRLSYPYTAVLIQEDWQVGLVVPSHFAIIRSNTNMVLPAFIYWYLSQESTKVAITKNSSGSTAFGTISSGQIAELPIKKIPLKQQEILTRILTLSIKEQELLRSLTEQKKIYNQTILRKIYEDEV